MLFDQLWTGVVEDRVNDPLQLGRVKVRIFGIHSPLKVISETEGSTTDSLLWCHVMMPANSASISGVGDSPTGLVEGSHVVGFFRDKMCQSGVVLGSIGGFPVAEANPNEGFNDPNGQYPRYINAPDTNIRARGGKTPRFNRPGRGSPGAPSHRTPTTVQDQNLNTDKAYNADKRAAEDIKPSPVPNMSIREMLIFNEGIRVKVYWDTEGYPTVGIGHLIVKEKTKNMNRINTLLSQQVGRVITDGTITTEEANGLFEQDLARTLVSIRNNDRVWNVYQALNDTRKMVIVDMTFQMGIGGVAGFERALTSMFLDDWKNAHYHMLDSDWAKQTPGRANRNANVILRGNLSPYGVTSNIRLRSATQYSGGDVLFTEPDSPYAAQYPYNKVFESEAGHIEEFDSTPGAERYYLLHPSGTFEEVHPGGTRVLKIVGEDYTITKSNKNLHVSGNMNIVVDGNAVIRVQGNVDQTIEGNSTQLIRGDVTAQIDGNVNQTVNGNVTELVKGNTQNHTQGDYTQLVDGNYTLQVTGNKSDTVQGNFNTKVEGSIDDQVSGSWTRKTTGDVTDSSSGTHKTEGNGAYTELNSSATVSGSTINLN